MIRRNDYPLHRLAWIVKLLLELRSGDDTSSNGLVVPACISFRAEAMNPNKANPTPQVIEIATVSPKPRNSVIAKNLLINSQQRVLRGQFKIQ